MIQLHFNPLLLDYAIFQIMPQIMNFQQTGEFDNFIIKKKQLIKLGQLECLRIFIKQIIRY